MQYLVFDFADENKEVLKKYKKVWDGIKSEIETINGCHVLIQKAMNFNDVSIISVKGSDYRKSLMQKAMNFNDVSIISVKGSDYRKSTFGVWAKIMQ